MAVTKATVNGVRSRLGQGDGVQFVDARNAQAWGEADARLPGAVRVPPDEPEKHLASVGRDRPVITYCACPNEESSTRVAEALERHGYEDVHPLEGGFDAWRKAGMPVEPK